MPREILVERTSRTRLLGSTSLRLVRHVSGCSPAPPDLPRTNRPTVPVSAMFSPVWDKGGSMHIVDFAVGVLGAIAPIRGYPRRPAVCRRKGARPRLAYAQVSGFGLVSKPLCSLPCAMINFGQLQAFEAVEGAWDVFNCVASHSVRARSSSTGWDSVGFAVLSSLKGPSVWPSMSCGEGKPGLPVR